MLWKQLCKEFCVMLVGVPAVLSASTASVLLTLKYAEKYVFDAKK